MDGTATAAAMATAATRRMRGIDCSFRREMRVGEEAAQGCYAAGRMFWLRWKRLSGS